MFAVPPAASLQDQKARTPDQVRNLKEEWHMEFSREEPKHGTGTACEEKKSNPVRISEA